MFLGCFAHRSQRLLIKAMSVDTELYLIDAIELEGQVMPAIAEFRDRADPATADRLLLGTLSGESFQALLTTNPVLARYFAQESRDLLSGNLPSEMFDETTGEVTANPEVIKQRITENVLTRFLVLFSCARYPTGQPTGITMNRGALGDYLRNRSGWIDDMLSLSNEFLWEAPDLKPSIGVQAKLLTRDQARILLDAVGKISAPEEPVLRSHYKSLEVSLRTAVEDERYRILLCIG